MSNPKPGELFKAAKQGDVARIRELLAAGIPVDSRDTDQLTPLLRAAENGQAEAFQTLLQAGADLYAVGMGLSQVDVLECAAMGGNVDIVRFLLDKGLPVEGHWQPRSNVARRLGHQTPLILAAIYAHADVVGLLLQAGADRNAMCNGQTALKIAQEEIRVPTFAHSAERKQQFVEIVALLSEPQADSESAPDTAAEEVARFAENAQQPAYAALCQKLTALCGEARAWQAAPDHGIAAAGVVRFRLRQCKKQKILDDLQQEALQSECCLVLSEPWVAGEDAELTLFPTKDKFAVIAANGTEGANYGVHTSDIIRWLRDLDKDNPFMLCYCSHDLVGGAFAKSVKGAKKLAQRMVEFCPSVLDKGFESPEGLAKALTKGRTFLLRWD